MFKKIIPHGGSIDIYTYLCLSSEFSDLLELANQKSSLTPLSCPLHIPKYICSLSRFHQLHLFLMSRIIYWIQITLHVLYYQFL